MNPSTPPLAPLAPALPPGSGTSAAPSIPSQVGKTFAITGANSGIGLSSALILAGRGARVILACRDAHRGRAALEQVRQVATAAEPEQVGLDLGDFASIRAAGDEIGARAPRLDVLMNNAGVMALPPTRSVDGYEAHLAINHLGHFALTLRLLGSWEPHQRPALSPSHRTASGRDETAPGRPQLGATPLRAVARLLPVQARQPPVHA